MLVLGIAGSHRAGSYNAALLRAAREVAPIGMEIEEFDIRELPLFDADLEAAGDPASVAAFKQAIRDADALVIATPEYNRGVPGVLKNAIDWASRPPLASPLTNKPVSVMGASTGRGGTARAQEQLRSALEYSRARVVEQPEVLVPEAYMVFDAEGRLIDESTREDLVELLAALAHESAAGSRSRTSRANASRLVELRRGPRYSALSQWTTQDGAFMEQSGCNRAQAVANARAAKLPRMRNNRCRQLPAVAVPPKW